MINQVLVLGDGGRLSLIGMSVKEQTPYIPLDGSALVKRHDLPKNWFGAGQYVLVVVDLERIGGSVLRLMGLEDHCAAIGLPILVLTTKEEPPYVVFGDGGPYHDGRSPNPPWRIVCQPADRDQALQKFTAWKASQ